MVVGELRGKGTRERGAGGHFSRSLKGNGNRGLHRVETAGEERRTWVQLLGLLEIQGMKLINGYLRK